MTEHFKRKLSRISALLRKFVSVPVSRRRDESFRPGTFAALVLRFPKLLLAFTLLCNILSAQPAIDRVDVRVNTPSGPLTQLTVVDLQLTANGHSVPIATCDFTRPPIDLIFIIDLSTVEDSVDGDRLLHTLGDNIMALPSQDRVGGLRLYKSSIEKVSDLTYRHRDVIHTYNRKSIPGGRRPDSVRLFDALLTASQMFPPAEDKRRRVVLIMAGDRERGSDISESRLLPRLQDSAVVVSEVVAPAAPPTRSGGVILPIPRIGRPGKKLSEGSSLQSICRSTGGRLSTWRGASNIIEDTIEQSRSAYTISFQVPSQGSGALSVTLRPETRAQHPGAEVWHSRR